MIFEISVKTTKFAKTAYYKDIKQVIPDLEVEEEAGNPQLQQYIVEQLRKKAVAIKYPDTETHLVVYDLSVIQRVKVLGKQDSKDLNLSNLVQEIATDLGVNVSNEQLDDVINLFKSLGMVDVLKGGLNGRINEIKGRGKKTIKVI